MAVSPLSSSFGYLTHPCDDRTPTAAENPSSASAGKVRTDGRTKRSNDSSDSDAKKMTLQSVHGGQSRSIDSPRSPNPRAAELKYPKKDDQIDAGKWSTVNIEGPLKEEIDISSDCFLKDLKRMNRPILDPANYINDYVENEIRRFEKDSKTSTGLHPDSLIPVVCTVNDPWDPAPKTKYFTLTDIVTGQYLHEVQKMLDQADRLYGDFRIDADKSLIKALTRENLQTRMERALSDYQNDPEQGGVLKSFYERMVGLRCIKYLSDHIDEPGSSKDHVRAVKDFLTGKLQAREVKFHGSLLNGVFLIPCGAGGVLFSVDENKCFYIGEEKLKSDSLGRKKSHSSAEFPNTDEFKKWVLRKLPVRDAYDFMKGGSKFDGGNYIDRKITYSPIFGRPLVPEKTSPFTFVEIKNRDELGSRLFDGYMSRLKSDIDAMVFTEGEQITLRMLEIAKAVMLVGSIPLATVSGGTASALARISHFLVSLAIDAGYVAASAVQAHISDRNEQAEEYLQQAWASGILMGGTGLPLAGKAVHRIFSSEKNIEHAIDLYRQVNTLSQRAMPRFLTELRWRHLTDRSKVRLLRNTGLASKPAKELARLTSKKTVSQSIRRNLVLDFEGKQKDRFAWSDLITEQAYVKRRLASDLRRLTETNEYIRHLLDNPPVIVRRRWRGIKERAAMKWIFNRSRSKLTMSADQKKTQKRDILDVINKYRGADLLDIKTIDAIQHDVYQPVAGQAERTFRTSSDAVFMGSDVGHAGFEKMLDGIKKISPDGKVTPDVLFAATVRYHPYGDGNGRTARTLYALARLQKEEEFFMALTRQDENALSGLNF